MKPGHPDEQRSVEQRRQSSSPEKAERPVGLSPALRASRMATSEIEMATTVDSSCAASARRERLPVSTATRISEEVDEDRAALTFSASRRRHRVPGDIVLPLCGGTDQVSAPPRRLAGHRQVRPNRRCRPARNSTHRAIERTMTTIRRPSSPATAALSGAPTRRAPAMPRGAEGGGTSGSPDPGVGWRECRDAGGDGTNRGAAGVRVMRTGWDQGSGVSSPGSWRSRAQCHDSIQASSSPRRGERHPSVEFGVSLIVVTVVLRRRLLHCPHQSTRPGFSMTPGRARRGGGTWTWGCGGSRRPSHRRLSCPTHGVVVEAVPFARPGANLTRRLRRL